jgi:hypothetical protein
MPARTVVKSAKVVSPTNRVAAVESAMMPITGTLPSPFMRQMESRAAKIFHMLAGVDQVAVQSAS